MTDISRIKKKPQTELTVLGEILGGTTGGAPSRLPDFPR
jgi:hypothetical protein